MKFHLTISKISPNKILSNTLATYLYRFFKMGDKTEEGIKRVFF